MNRRATEEAVREAERFIARVRELLKEDDRVKRLEKEAEKAGRREYIAGPFYGSRESGSARRASLDLTRALAEMRQSSAWGGE